MCEKLLKKYEKQGKYEKIIEVIDKEILKNPKKASSLLIKKAIALIQLKKYKQALTTLNVILNDSNDKYVIYLLINECYVKLDEYEKVYEYLKKALETKPNDEFLLKQLSYCAYLTKKYQECCNYVETLIQIDKADIEDYCNLIYCLIPLGEIEKALKYTQKVLEIDPTNLDAYASLAVVYESIEDNDKLKEVYYRILELDDDGSLQIMLLKSQAYLELGYEKEAFNFVEKAIKLNSYNPTPYLMKTILCQKLGMQEQAKESLYEALNLEPNLMFKLMKP